METKPRAFDELLFIDKTIERLKTKNKKLQTEVKRLREKNRHLRDAVHAYQDLGTCYRFGKRPTEELFTRLDFARLTIETPEGGEVEDGL